MKIKEVIMEKEVREKLLDKHNVGSSEVKEVLLGSPYFIRAKWDRYLAIGCSNRFLTIVF
ncbi:hypothetical protein CMI42_02645 [Candidatus Pacearchaeota archaeon]|jgi:hypothetical protein|nr:hypothetical protein [Candidatus Pacearchaeota archaeon]|tara:strand:- start:1451 stop:1630 length:180 start_codon:yes stop_codon:yes gene_type:complete